MQHLLNVETHSLLALILFIIIRVFEGKDQNIEV